MRQFDFAYKPTQSKHYLPNANDPNYIHLLHVGECHDLRTFGEGTRHGAVQTIARIKRLQKRHGRDANGNKIATPREDTTAKRKKKWPSRPLPKGRKVPGGKLTQWARRYNRDTKRWETVKRA